MVHHSVSSPRLREMARGLGNRAKYDGAGRAMANGSVVGTQLDHNHGLTDQSMASPWLINFCVGNPRQSGSLRGSRCGYSTPTATCLETSQPSHRDMDLCCRHRMGVPGP